MIPEPIAAFFLANQEVLWFTTLFLDLGFTVILFRLFGKAGLQVAIATAIILANIQGPKLTVIFGLETTMGVIFYSSIFFATDVLSENYGKREANKAVWMGFVVSVIVLSMLSFAVMYLPTDKSAAAGFSQPLHDAFVTIANFAPLMVFGSLTAYLISQRFDVWAFHKIKSITGERWLWLRNNGSTIASQMLDTAIFSLIIWAHEVGIRQALIYGFAKFIFKIVIAAIDTIFVYWARRSFLRHEPLME
ncbi:MAG: queuosine precursor transporter [Woeseiaceae bacterium]|nr:queuosine precursor transporter [Woeseiaceae bacterium]NIP22030.1 queuosine precursor transporter [Woeseiaceae bacterium]NIS91154.1 queuosine precursor transporter [Woeseiaceae bacterium]